MPVKILLTGGTIDKEYDKIHGQLVLTKSHINQSPAADWMFRGDSHVERQPEHEHERP